MDISAMLFMALMGVHFLISYSHHRVARLWAWICFNTVCYLLFSRYIHADGIPPAYQIDLGWMLVPVRWAMNFTPGLFMMLSFFLFQDERKFPRWLLGLFVAQVLLEEPLPLALAIDVEQGDLLFEVLPAGLQLFFVAVAIYWAVRRWQADVIEERRWLRFVFLAVVGGYIVASVFIGRILVGLGFLPPMVGYVSLNALLSLIGVSAVFFSLRRGIEALTAPGDMTVSEAAPPPVDLSSSRDLAALVQAFESDCVYREGGLTVSSLATRLRIPEYRLRKLIHEGLGYRNFNALLHRYRIEEVKRRLVSDEDRNTPILTLALSVGYQSINPFNRAFREQEGMSPSEYRSSFLAAQAQKREPGQEKTAPFPGKPS